MNGFHKSEILMIIVMKTKRENDRQTPEDLNEHIRMGLCHENTNSNTMS